MSGTLQFVDSFGFSWQAVEITHDATSTGPEALDNWLYFLARGTTRRLRAYPVNWAALNWSDLEDLCTRAEVVGTDAGSLPVRAFSKQLRAAAG